MAKAEDDKVEFEFSFEKFSIKYKGPAARGQALQGSLGNALTSLTDLQKQASSAEPPKEPKFIESNVVDAAAKGDDRTKRKASKSDGKLGGIIDGLIDEGFFNTPKSLEDISAELAKRAQNYKPNHIAATLVHRTQTKKLKREKNAADSWSYTKYA